MIVVAHLTKGLIMIVIMIEMIDPLIQETETNLTVLDCLLAIYFNILMLMI